VEGVEELPPNTLTALAVALCLTLAQPLSLSAAITQAKTALHRVRRQLDPEDDEGLRQHLLACEVALERRRSSRFVITRYERFAFSDAGVIVQVDSPDGAIVRMKILEKSSSTAKTGLARVPTESGQTAHLDVFLILGMAVLAEAVASSTGRDRREIKASRILARIVDRFWGRGERLKDKTARDPANIRKQERQARKRTGLHAPSGLTEHLFEEASQNHRLRAWIPG
jgi:hypothetical protein